MKINSQLRTFDASDTAVAFPLGGIGTGNVSLSARGKLQDWEIFNRPAKGKKIPNTFFAIRTQVGDEEPVSRVLEGQIQAPYTLSHGYHPEQYAGLPHMADSKFYGQYPFAQIDFTEPDLPVDVQLEAFTPLVPLNAEDSGIPCAIMTYTVTNRLDKPVDVSIAGSLYNQVGKLDYNIFGHAKPDHQRQSTNEIRQEEGLNGVFLHAPGLPTDDLHFGSMSLATDFPNASIKPAWLRGAWWDFLREFWSDFVEDGKLTDLGYDLVPEEGVPDTASVCTFDTLEAGATRSYRFVLAWHFPNRWDSWEYPEWIDPDKPTPKVARNHYATRFADAWAVSRYTVNEIERLERDSRNFHDALFDSTLPPTVLDALSANIVPIRSNTCFWLEDGRFFGWEGCHDEAGCCAGSCTHVWSYAYTAAYLFPSLEREMRRIEFAIETEEDGYMTFRTLRTNNETFEWTWGEQKPEACVDGQMGSILRAYREWKLSGDKGWIASIWPGIKRAIRYAGNHWDTDGDGVLDSKQHNTYDIEFYGPNPLSNIYYLAGLRAVEELAQMMGEPDVAEECRAIFEKSAPKMDEMLWNGDFFIQKIDNVNAYYYQHGEGCLSDQLLGQLHARALGLGDLVPAEHVKTAVHSIFKHNFRESFAKHVNLQRTYVLNDEAGLLMCSWPNGGEPTYPFVYSDEAWTGTEYQVAAHLIYEGWLDEGLKIVEAVRARHDGVRRNPWNEVECGHHYARTMSSWAVLLALTGQQGNVAQGELSFAPTAGINNADVFQTFWSNGKAWGVYRQSEDGTGEVEVLGGDVSGLSVTANGQSVSVR